MTWPVGRPPRWPTGPSQDSVSVVDLKLHNCMRDFRSSAHRDAVFLATDIGSTDWFSARPHARDRTVTGG